MSWQPREISTAAIILLGLATQQGSARVWTDVTCRYRAEAEFAEVVGQNVVLRKPSGLYVNVPLTKLSRQDQVLARCLGTPLLLGVGSPQILLPDSQADELLVVVNGSGSTAEEALRDAMQMAVHVASGTLVHGETRVKDHSISEQTLLFSRGFVSHYEILAERYDPNSVRRRIAATVQRRALGHAADSPTGGTSVDATDLYPEAYSKILRRRNGLPMFEQMLAALPARILRIELAGSPRLTRLGEDQATLAYELTLAIDLADYRQWQREAVEILESLATHSGTLEGLSRNLPLRLKSHGESLFRTQFLLGSTAGWTPDFPPIDIFQRVSAVDRSPNTLGKKVPRDPATLVVVHNGLAEGKSRMSWTWFELDSPLSIDTTDVVATVTYEDANSTSVRSERLTIGPALPGISSCRDGRSEGNPQTLVLSPFFLCHGGEGYRVRDLKFVRSFSIRKQSTLTLDELSRVKRMSVSLAR